jgi:hypothetical protein
MTCQFAVWRIAELIKREQDRIANYGVGAQRRAA